MSLALWWRDHMKNDVFSLESVSAWLCQHGAADESGATWRYIIHFLCHLCPTPYVVYFKAARRYGSYGVNPVA